MTPVVSVITVCFNAASDLQKTIESVRNQSYNNIEYVIVDGGSQDGSREVIAASGDVVSKWVSRSDKGLYYAMNDGLDMASGEYVLFLNAGDVFFESSTLEKIFSLSPSDMDIYYGDTMICDSMGNNVGRRRIKLPVQLSAKSFRWGMSVCHQSVLIRRSICSHYDTSYRITADYDWVLSAIEMAEPNKICNTGLFVSCFQQGGLSSRHIKKANLERFVIMKKHYGLVQSLWFNFLMVFRLLFTYCKLGRI